jgi:hypothetical protein
MAALLGNDLLEQVMTHVDQPSKAACFVVSKDFSRAALQPATWTSLHLHSLSPEAQTFVRKCVNLQTLKITTDDIDALSEFLCAEHYSSSVTDVTLHVYTETPRSLLLLMLLNAFPGAQRVDFYVEGVDGMWTIMVPEATLQSFQFWDENMMVKVQCAPTFRAEKIVIKADSIESLHPDNAVNFAWMSSSSVSSSEDLPRARHLVLELDDHCAFTYNTDAETVTFMMYGLDLLIDMTAVRDMPNVRTLEFKYAPFVQDSGSVTFAPIGVKEFYDFFYGPAKQVNLKIPEMVRLELLPTL